MELFRKELIKILQLPENIRKLPEEEVNEMIKKQKKKVEEILENMETEKTEYELSERQKKTKEMAINQIAQSNYLEAYFGILDLVDDYGETHEGKVFEIEKTEICNLLKMLVVTLEMEEEEKKSPKIVKKGAVRFWGHFDGRPYDTYSVVNSVVWKEKEIILYLNHDEIYTLYNPKGIVNTDTEFHITEVTKMVKEYGIGNSNNRVKKEYTYVDNETILVEYKGMVSKMKPEGKYAFEIC